MLKKGMTSLTRRNFHVSQDTSPLTSRIMSAARSAAPGLPESISSIMSITASRAPVSTKETALERSLASAAVVTRLFDITVANILPTIRAGMFPSSGVNSSVWRLLCR